MRKTIFRTFSIIFAIFFYSPLRPARVANDQKPVQPQILPSQ